VKIRIDFELCQSHGVCMEESPEVFRVLDDGSLSLLQEEPPEALWDAVRSAERYCPTRAISLED
jgi:ferredoxin